MFSKFAEQIDKCLANAVGRALNRFPAHGQQLFSKYQAWIPAIRVVPRLKGLDLGAEWGCLNFPWSKSME